VSASGAVVITGASTGIGRACALRLDRAGFDVFAGVRKTEDGESIVAQASARLKPLIIDVTDADSIAAAAAQVNEATGGQLAGLVNNAGIAVAGPVEALDIDELRRQFEVNFFGQVAVTQALLAALRAAKGRVVFMSSVGGRPGGALPYASPYGASKHALEALADSLRIEMRPFGVEVSIIEPGAVATPIWDKSIGEAAVTREGVSPELLEVYGDRMDKMSTLAAKTGARGVDPDDVAAAVEAALTAPKPKTRQVVGREAKIQARLASILPSRTFDRIIERELEKS
jgi:NAD(P)-dependent dehydrogenase (short-subunit alcohol dehydrogenase family)